MNKLVLVGNLTKDPEVGETSGGIAYAKCAIAVTRNYTNQDGERETDFFDFTLWRERAELAEKYLHKGSKVGIVGSIQNRSWEDEEGNKRKMTEIKVDEIEFLSPKKTEDEEEKSNKKGGPELTPIEDDGQVPF